MTKSQQLIYSIFSEQINPLVDSGQHDDAVEVINKYFTVNSVTNTYFSIEFDAMFIFNAPINVFVKSISLGINDKINVYAEVR